MLISLGTEKTNALNGGLVIASQADPLSPHSWSGIPFGLAEGLRSAGVEVAGVSSELVAPVDKLLRVLLSVRYGDRTSHSFGSEMAWIRSRVVSRELQALRPGGIVQLGTGFRVAHTSPIVTLEDATVAQSARELPDVYRRIRPSVIDHWILRQAAIYREARACCCASQWAKHSIVSEYGIRAEKVYVVGFGRNLEVSPVDRDWTTPRFLWIGRDWERKNGPRVLRAFAEVRLAHPHARLDFVGDHPSLDYPGVHAHGPLTITDRREETMLKALVERATAFVMPSLFEPFGIVYVEAGAGGVASIGTTRGGAGDAIGPGGVLVEPTDDGALLQAMSMLADEANARTLGENAIRHASKYTWRAVAERILSALCLLPPDGKGI